MLASKICLATVLLSLHAVNSYILLTANLDDMHALAKQIAESPVANQINSIIRRAANIFKEAGEHGQNESSRKHQMRSDLKLDDSSSNMNETQDLVEKTGTNQPNSTKKSEVEVKTNAAAGVSGHDLDVWVPDQKALAAELNATSSDSASEVSGESNRAKGHHVMRRDQADPGFAELGRNASFYLNSIKKIFENV